MSTTTLCRLSAIRARIECRNIQEMYFFTNRRLGRQYRPQAGTGQYLPNRLQYLQKGFSSRMMYWVSNWSPIAAGINNYIHNVYGKWWDLDKHPAG